MGYVLGIDTSSVELGIGLVNAARPAMGISRYFRNSHAEHISQAIEFLLATNNISMSDISHAGIAVGPGSFTGLRIGIAFLKGFFFGHPVKVLPVSSLESMAASWQCKNRSIVCASDARNNEVFWARFANDNGIVTRISGDLLSPFDSFASSIGPQDIVLTDTLGHEKSTVFDFIIKRPDAYSVELHGVQRGLSCALIASRTPDTDEAWRLTQEIVPNYLNRSWAEKKHQIPL
jgi:tRNA threonylcarbamoyladenosine biosynthesis protein TsaB